VEFPEFFLPNGSGAHWRSETKSSAARGSALPHFKLARSSIEQRRFSRCNSCKSFRFMIERSDCLTDWMVAKTAIVGRLIRAKPQPLRLSIDNVPILFGSPAAILNGPGISFAKVFASSTVTTEVTKTKSAPASRYRVARLIASLSPPFLSLATANASVLPLMTRSGTLHFSAALRVQRFFPPLCRYQSHS